MINLSEVKDTDKIINEDTNRKNIDTFVELLPHFYYKDEDVEEIINIINGRSLNDEHNYIKNVLGLDQFGRRWFEVSAEEDTNTAYISYIKHLNNVSNENKKEIIKRFSLSSKEVFDSALVVDNKQTFKLFKFLKKEKILSDAIIEKITTLRAKSSNKKYLCLSKNPIDMLMCSTGQSGYSSCISLESTYHGAYYFALPGLVLDPNRIICFITNGKLLNYTIKEKDVKYFNYDIRSWVISMEDNSFFWVRSFPSHKYNVNSMLNKAYNVDNMFKYVDAYSREKSMFEFKLPRLRDGKELLVYLDTMGIRHEKTDSDSNRRFYVYSKFNSKNGAVFSLNCSLTFERIEKFEELYKRLFKCNKCNDKVGESQIRAVNDMYLCETCFLEDYFRCDICGCSEGKDKSIINPNGGTICKNCFNKYYFTCKSCKNVFKKGDIEFKSDNNDTYCIDCFNKRYFECNECGTIQRRNKAKYGNNNITFCHKCYDLVFGKCKRCGEVFERLNINEGRNKYCDKCFDEIFIECEFCLDSIKRENAIEFEGNVICNTCYEIEMSERGQ